MELASRSSEYPFGYSDVLVGECPKPPTARSRARSNVPDGTALSLPLVAHSCTSAQEDLGVFRAPAAPVTARFFHSLAVTSTCIFLTCPSGMARIVSLLTVAV